MNVEIWSLGKENEPFIEEGLNYYFQKTRAWNGVEVVLLQTPKKMATTDVERTKKQEEELILKKLFFERSLDGAHPRRSRKQVRSHLTQGYR